MRQKGWFVLDAATAVVIVLAVVCPIEGSIANAATCSGVVLASGSSIQKAIDSHAGGTTFCLSGTYTTATPISPKDGDRFIGTAATNISGTGSGVFSGGKNVLYDSIGIGPSPGDGVRPGSGSTIQNSTIHDNKKCGITTFGSSLLITNNEIARNGSTSTSPISQACGLKIRGMQGSDSGAYSTVSNNVVHDNVHTALWVDCNGHDNVFSNNTVYGNTGIALDEETGYRDTFRGNIVHDNGFGFQIQAVSILDSMGGTVANNTLTNNYRGVRIWADRRAQVSSPQVGTGCAGSSGGYIPSHISITGNTFMTPQRTGFAPGKVNASAATFDANCYKVGTMSDTNWTLPEDSTATWTQWRGAGKDPNGTATTTGC